MIKTIPVDKLVPGMYVQGLTKSWLDHPIWRTHFLVRNDTVRAALRDAGIGEVQIDTSRGIDLAADSVAQAVAGTVADVPELAMAGATEQAGAGAVASQGSAIGKALVAQTAADTFVTDVGARVPIASRAAAVRCAAAALHEELHQARQLIAGSKGEVSRMFSEARMGKVPDTAAVAELTDEISASIGRNRDALLSLARLKTADDYTYLHSVAVCGLMIALARELELPDEQVRKAGVAGLLHDIGKMSIPAAILNKPGRLSDEELVLVRGHPQAGWEILSKVPGTEPVALEVALHHHEKFDGTGYPHGLAREGIDLFARMGAVCDVYDAVTSRRAYNRGWDPGETVRRMATWEGHFDPMIFHAFVRAVGIYPVGSLVRLASGRLAVVLAQAGESLLTPTVRPFYDIAAEERIVAPPITLDRSSGDRIVGREDPVVWGFEGLDALWLDAGD